MRACSVAETKQADSGAVIETFHQTLWLVHMDAAALLSLHVMQQVHTCQHAWQAAAHPSLV